MVSLIVTVLNERNNLEEWLKGILSQTVLPDEIIIVDGGSKDGTWEKLQEKSSTNSLIKVWQQPGNIAVGRNFAISKASGQIIVVTDAGCDYDRNWMKKITEPILSGKSTFVATGFGPWFFSTDSLLTHLIAAATIPAPAEFKKNWLPSSRSIAFKKELWEKVGGYPEWIPICEDIIFDLKIFHLGTSPEFIRESLVFWRPRTKLKTYFKQLFSYTRSDGHGKLWFSRQLIRYTSYIGDLILLALAIKVSWWFAVVLVVGLLLYISKFWLRWFAFSKQLSLTHKVIGWPLVPFIVVFGDIAKMCGWPLGVYERYTGKITYQKF